MTCPGKFVFHATVTNFSLYLHVKGGNAALALPEDTCVIIINYDS